jgi:hypothetical protein
MRVPSAIDVKAARPKVVQHFHLTEEALPHGGVRRSMGAADARSAATSAIDPRRDTFNDLVTNRGTLALGRTDFSGAVWTAATGERLNLRPELRGACSHRRGRMRPPTWP